MGKGDYRWRHNRERYKALKEWDQQDKRNVCIQIDDRVRLFLYSYTGMHAHIHIHPWKKKITAKCRSHGPEVSSYLCTCSTSRPNLSPTRRTITKILPSHNSTFWQQVITVNPRHLVACFEISQPIPVPTAGHKIISFTTPAVRGG